MNTLRSRIPHIAVLFTAVGLAILFLTVNAQPRAQQAEATPVEAENPLDPPLVSEPPTQLDQGALLFWGVCMA